MKNERLRNPRPPSRELAYTLAEVMVSVAVVSVLFGSLYLGISFAFAQTKGERENLRATQVILQRMEGIRLYNWNQITNAALNPSTFYEQYLPASAGLAASGVIYTGQVDVASVTLSPAATYSANMKKVTVTVRWSSGSVLRTRSASTYVAKDGVQNYIYSN